MNENIVKAQQTMNLVVADIRAAWQDACAALEVLPTGSNGTASDLALRAFLADCLQAAHALESKLLQL